MDSSVDGGNSGCEEMEKFLDENASPIFHLTLRP